MVGSPERGHWYMTLRIDCWWYDHPGGWIWHGWLITGGQNSSFKMRPTKRSSRFEEARRLFGCPLKRPNIYPEPDVDALRITDDGKTVLFAKKVTELGWVYGKDLGELFANRLLGKRDSDSILLV